MGRTGSHGRHGSTPCFRALRGLREPVSLQLKRLETTYDSCSITAWTRNEHLRGTWSFLSLSLSL